MSDLIKAFLAAPPEVKRELELLFNPNPAKQIAAARALGALGYVPAAETLLSPGGMGEIGPRDYAERLNRLQMIATRRPVKSSRHSTTRPSLRPCPR